MTNIGVDRAQLSSMARQARDALDAKTMEVVADKGYFNNNEIAACEDAGIAAYVPKPATSNAKAQGRFDKRDFAYDPAKDYYVCPAGNHLTHRMTSEEKGQQIRVYWTNVCETCPLKSATARLAKNAVSDDGNAKMYLSACKRGSTASLARCMCAARPSNIHSAPSKHGWAQRISK